MDETFRHAEHSSRENFMKALEQRLYDGCSVTFTVPHDVGTELASDVLRRLRDRDCLTADLDLAPIRTIGEFAGALARKYLQLMAGDIGSSANATEGLLDKLSDPDEDKKIRDVVDLTHLEQMNAWEKLDWAVELAEIIAKRNDTRLVVWFHEWQEIARIESCDLLLKRLRAMFQFQPNVTYAFVGSDPSLMPTLFADRHQAFYRFAVMLKFSE